MATKDPKDLIEDDEDHGPQQGVPLVDNGEFSDLGFDPDRKLKIVGTTPIKPDGVDKVTGRAKFGADTQLPGMLVGKILRSPHAHAIIKSIDTSEAEKLPGVKAVCTRDDFPDIKPGPMKDISYICMAREKVFFDGHQVAAVAATSEKIAKQALKLIKVEYEVLPHVIDVMDAVKDDAPILHEGNRPKGIDDWPEDKQTNILERAEWSKGDVEKGFEEADLIVEREFDTKPMHQSYIEPQGCIANYTEDGQFELWTCTQAHFVYRSRLAAILEMDISKIRVSVSELGGGFGGKTMFYAEPLAAVLSRKANRPVKMVLTRNEVFRATGPVAGTHSRIKIGVKKDGKFTAAEAEMYFQTGPFTGSAFGNAPQACFTRYDLENIRAYGYEVVSNRPKVNAFRAPCVPQIVFGVEGVVDEIARRLKMDPIDLRLKNAATEGYETVYGYTFGPVGFVETLKAAKEHPHYKSKLGPNQGRGIGCGFWFNRGGETTASLNITPDGSVNLMLGNPDVAGSRGSIAMMAAEELGVPFDKVRPIIGDTSSLGYNHSTVGSRVTFSAGMAIVRSARNAIKILCQRAAKEWGVPEDSVVFEDGYVRPASANVGDFEPLSVADIAKKAGQTGGAIAGHAEINATGAGPGFGVHICDVEVDKETGLVKILRYTVVEDAGKAIHPLQVEGQFQGGAVQGIGWALNEEYIYNEEGRMENPGFLDYRIPVCSDVPMIDTQIIEVPNPLHPYGLRGVGEVPVVPTLGTVANAVGDAIGVRPRSLPMSPPKVLQLIEEVEANGVDEPYAA
ncbi:MAG: xanthine dehydrogenase family protein molybdopterin-binding subunit [Alphaproteobacteria bacterium]|nr:xanthine dehydrogenase family protein molybdopterin-binding subunit [Alphaproteobacteria bacterium]